MNDARQIEQLRDALSDLRQASTRLSAYAAGVAERGNGQRTTMRNLVADVERAAENARRLLSADRPEPS